MKHSVLSDEQKRSNYDRFGHAAFDGTGSGFVIDGFGFGGLDDLLRPLWGAFGRGRKSTRNGPVRGRDIQYSIDITFEEAAFGVTKEIS